MKRKAFMTLVGKVYKKAAEDFADTSLKLSDENSADDAELDDDEVSKVLTKLDGEKVTGLTKTNFDKGFDKGKSQTAKQFEKKLRETFEVEDATLEGDDLIDHIKEIAPEGAIPADLTKLTAEDVVKLPAVKKMIQDQKRAVKDLETKHTAELEAERGKQGQAQLLNEVIKKAEARLTREGFKVNLPEDAAKREARLEKLLRSELKGATWQKQKDGSIIPVDAEGVQIEDPNGNPIDLDAFADSIIDTNFDFIAVTPEPPKTPQNKNTPTQTTQVEKKQYTGRKPSNQDDYLDLLTGSELDTDQKAALKDNFSDQFR